MKCADLMFLFQSRREELRAIFEVYGIVKNINLIFHRGNQIKYGFISYETKEEAKNALEKGDKPGIYYKGYRLLILQAFRKKGSESIMGSKNGFQPPSNTNMRAEMPPNIM
ncbi:hypothetical protein NPIL_168801 [Nephila pilipes]|uniref:RRM domain-containing protein n=1 Tax=Nephila pilipes TaxID=299642 RepID=A0A8X6QL29_NEPPI|nr:hypothetical protein NPIL_168801 [Nephila pilipes]